MSPLLRRANENSETTWIPLPEGIARFRVGTPEVKYNDRWQDQSVIFPLQACLADQKRILEQVHVELGEQQSFRTRYTVGLSLGWVDKSGTYHSTKLTDMLAAILGSSNARHFRDWLKNGGGPPRPVDLDDDKEELKLIGEWLGWFEDMEVYGTITHRTGGDGRVWADFAGPIAVGNMPNERDDEYQALGRGKLRVMVQQSGEKREDKHREERVAAGDRPPAQRFNQDGTEAIGDGSPELPF